MKNMLKVMLSSLMVMVAAGCAFAFPDVDGDYWAAKQINELNAKGVIVGYPDGSFKPDENVTRAEFASMAIKALGQEDIQVAQPVNFSDITQDFWAYDSIQKALYFDLISNKSSDDTFRPDDSVSRAESITMAVNALTTQEISDYKALTALQDYEDLKDIPQDFLIPAGKAQILNMLVTMPVVGDKKIDAKRPATRAEVAAILYRMIEEARLNPNAKLAEVMRKKTGEGYVVEGATVQGSVGTIPAGSVVPIKLTQPVSSQKNKSGDIYIGVIPTNYVTKENYILIYQNSQLKGQLMDVKAGRWFIRNGVVILDNALIVTPNDQTANFSASGALKKDRNWFMKFVRAVLKGEKLENFPDMTVDVKLLKPIKVDLTNGWIIE